MVLIRSLLQRTVGGDRSPRTYFKSLIDSEL